VRRKAQRRVRPEDEFLRALKARGGAPPREVPEPPPADGDGRGPSDPPDPLPDAPAAPETQPGPIAEGDLADIERRAAAAEAALQQVREEAERRLADARVTIEHEREARLAAEGRLATEPTHSAPAPAEIFELQRQMVETLQERMAALEESERHLREERERWETDAQQNAERRAAELATAERRIAEARAQMPAESGSLPAEPVERANLAPPPVPPPPADDAPHSPSIGLIQPRPARGGLRWLGTRRQARGYIACTTCAREFAGSAGQATATGWLVVDKTRVLCDECRRGGWDFPAGSSVPLREPTALDPHGNQQH
jgi:hypothetical protein